jgi:epoxyqueuosine reductase
MLIRPGLGSFCFIGVVLTDLELDPAGTGLAVDRCGSCTRCLEACPTGALLEDRVLDATRCISYHTIESRAPIPAEIAERINGWAFGCDICNEICPWNGRVADLGATPAPDDYRDRGAIAAGDPEFFERMDEATFAARFGDTPLERPGLAGMRRNWRAAWRSLGFPTEAG